MHVMKTVLAATLLSGSTLSGAAQTFTYPHPHTVDQVDDYFGTKVADPYRWMENVDAPDEEMIRVICTRARYTKVAPDGSLTDELDDSPSWGYWVPGLGYMGWGHASADDAREAAARRITSQLTVNRGDSRSVPMAVDIREQRETWLKAELWTKDPASGAEPRPQNGNPPRWR